MKRYFVVAYETVMIILVIVSTATILSSNINIPYIHTITWSIFLVDMIVRFILAATKWQYLKGHPFDLLSIIPFEDLFLLARFSRFLYLFRYKNAIKRYFDKLDKVL